MQFTLRHKINAAIIITFSLIAVLFAFIHYPLQNLRLKRAIGNVELLLTTLVERDTEQLANEIFDARITAAGIRLAQMLTVEGIVSIRLFDRNGNQLTSQGTVKSPEQITPEIRSELSTQHHIRQTFHRGEKVLVYTKSIKFLDEVFGFIRIHYTLAQVEKEQRVFLFVTAGVLGAVLLVMLIVLNWILSRAILRPVRDLRDATRFIVRGNLDKEILITRGDELGELADSFEKMRDAVKEKIADQERLTDLISNIIDSMPSALIGVDENLRITQWNRAAEDAFGISRDKVIGLRIDRAVADSGIDIQSLSHSITTRESQHLHKQLRTRNGRSVHEDVTIYPLSRNRPGGAVIRIDDVSEKVRMEEVIIQSEKMLSVGGLAAGMAHEINNPLAGMIQNASLVSNRLTDTRMPGNVRAAQSLGTEMEVIRDFMELRGIPGMLEAINTTGQRAADIVSNMLSFSRRGDERRDHHAMADLMDKTLDLAMTADYDLKKRLDFRQIEISRNYDDVPLIRCDGSKLQQVLLNILRNGAQAMHAHDTQAPGFDIRILYDRDRGFVITEISDNGPGMDENIRKRVFEPFFTTKEVGVGTGLGLSVSYFIITEDHGGFMEVSSDPGLGATFTIGLPVE